ncbi:MAG: 3-deoxy-manno-octulosonate cytidylyltransferase [Paludibacteraceae bacterium]|nr:3-deoxy-manno-octulosonate cytidylyltransferase [Paludibacteraceae bacterium]
MKYIGIIPARYASSRFPGKPLAEICGKTMIQRVYEQASKVLDTVIVATDDQRIYDCVKNFGGVVYMTSKEHRCGTDRICEAYQLYKEDPAFSPLTSLSNSSDYDTVVVNIQGDEPFIQPEQIKAVMDCFPTDIATLAKPYTAEDDIQELMTPNIVKVVFSQQTGEALYFSRSVIPYLRGVEQSEWLCNGQYYSHIGLYAYRADVLMRITQMPQTPLELAESLEQLRWLENGLKIKVAVSNTKSIGIDTPEDLQQAIEYFQIINQ